MGTHSLRRTNVNATLHRGAVGVGSVAEGILDSSAIGLGVTAAYGKSNGAQPRRLGTGERVGRGLMAVGPAIAGAVTKSLRWVGSLFRGSKPARAVAAAAPIVTAFKSGQMIERSFSSSEGTIEMLAIVEINGRSLHLKDIAIYPRGARELQVGTAGVNAMKAAIMDEARKAGFNELVITGERLYKNKPRRPVNVTIKL